MKKVFRVTITDGSRVLDTFDCGDMKLYGESGVYTFSNFRDKTLKCMSVPIGVGIVKEYHFKEEE